MSINIDDAFILPFLLFVVDSLFVDSFEDFSLLPSFLSLAFDESDFFFNASFSDFSLRFFSFSFSFLEGCWSDKPVFAFFDLASAFSFVFLVFGFKLNSLFLDFSFDSFLVSVCFLYSASSL